MNDLNIDTLASMGLVLPSAWSLLGSVLFGIVGYIAFRRGRKTARPTLTWSGLALMLYPYAVSETWLVWLIGAVLTGWVWVQWSDA